MMIRIHARERDTPQIRVEVIRLGTLQPRSVPRPSLLKLNQVKAIVLSSDLPVFSEN